MDLIEVKEKGSTNLFSERHPWERARLVFLKKLISHYTPIPPGSIVFDIGCGDTFVVENLAREFPDSVFYAVDIAFTDEIMEQYRKNLKNTNVFLYRSMDEVPSVNSKKSALVILTDVIEHIEDDKKFISQLLERGYFDENTNFLITVPAYQSLFCSHDVFLGHYRRYTNTLLKNNLAEAGLGVAHSGYFFFSLIPFRLFQVFKEKILGLKKKESSTGLVTWNKGAFTSSLFKILLVADSEITFFFKRAGINFPGLSNYAICRKLA